MSTNKPVPAAKKRGRGRPALQEGAETAPVNIRMTVAQREKLARLGGPPWVRDRIDKAHEPESWTGAAAVLRQSGRTGCLEPPDPT